MRKGGWGVDVDIFVIYLWRGEGGTKKTAAAAFCTGVKLVKARFLRFLLILLYVSAPQSQETRAFFAY